MSSGRMFVQEGAVFQYEGRKFKAKISVGFNGGIKRTDIVYYLGRGYIEEIKEEIVSMKKGELIKILGKTYISNISLKGYTLGQAEYDLKELLDGKLISLVEPKLYVVYKQRENSDNKILVKTAIYHTGEEVINDLKNMYYVEPKLGGGRNFEFKAEPVEAVGKFNVKLEEKETSGSWGVGVAPTECGLDLGSKRIPF